MLNLRNFAAFLLGIFLISGLYAAPRIKVYDTKETETSACLQTAELQEQIKSLISFPRPLWDLALEGEVEVSLTVDKENRVHVVRVKGESHYLTDHVDRSLDGKLIRAKGEWVGKVFTTTIEFKKLS